MNEKEQSRQADTAEAMGSVITQMAIATAVFKTTCWVMGVIGLSWVGWMLALALVVMLHMSGKLSAAGRQVGKLFRQFYNGLVDGFTAAKKDAEVTA